MQKVKNTHFPEHFDSLLDAIYYFKNEKVAIRYLHHRRWNGNPTCPHCDSNKICHFSDGKRFKCKSCSKHFTGRIGTIFENSKIPLRKWFIAIYLHTAHKKGIASYQLAKDIQVTQRTAWFMLQRIRHLLGADNNQDEQLEGLIEMDETFVGGKNKNRHRNKKIKGATGRMHPDKTPVVGMWQADGKVRTVVVEDTSSASLHPLIIRNIKEKSILVTDDWNPYKKMGLIYDHQIVEHSSGLYTNDCGFTTNHIEGFWNWIKRMIMGVYHNITRKYLQLYAHEATFRYNTRLLTDGQRLLYALALNNGKLSYKVLTGKQ